MSFSMAHFDTFAFLTAFERYEKNRRLDNISITISDKIFCQKQN